MEFVLSYELKVFSFSCLDCLLLLPFSVMLNLISFFAGDSYTPRSLIPGEGEWTVDGNLGEQLEFYLEESLRGIDSCLIIYSSYYFALHRADSRGFFYRFLLLQGLSPSILNQPPLFDDGFFRLFDKTFPLLIISYLVASSAILIKLVLNYDGRLFFCIINCNC